MSAIAFEFSRWDDGELSGFDLGDITVSGPDGIHTSRGKAPDQSLMIYISIAQLVTGLCDFLDGPKRAFEFVGVDSSYSIVFTKNPGRVLIGDRSSTIATTKGADVLNALSEGIQRFLGEPKNQLPSTDSAYEDLNRAAAILDASIRKARHTPT